MHDKFSHLPEKILADARKRAKRDDLDGAAEKYVLYLNTTSAVSSPEREEAIISCASISTWGWLGFRSSNPLAPVSAEVRTCVIEGITF